MRNQADTIHRNFRPLHGHALDECSDYLVSEKKKKKKKKKKIRTIHEELQGHDSEPRAGI